MPADLQKHIRYPETCYGVSGSAVLARITLDAPEVFYNREDLWQLRSRSSTAPDEMNAGGESQIAPYYIMMRLPGEPQTEFFLMLPMTGQVSENMIAWLATGCEICPRITWVCPLQVSAKDKLVYGPFQMWGVFESETRRFRQLLRCVKSSWLQGWWTRGAPWWCPSGTRYLLCVAAVSRTVWPAAGTRTHAMTVLGRPRGDGGDAPQGSGDGVAQESAGRGLVGSRPGSSPSGPAIEHGRGLADIVAAGDTDTAKGRGIGPVSAPNSTRCDRCWRSSVGCRLRAKARSG